MSAPKKVSGPMLRFIHPRDVVWGSSAARFGRRSVHDSRAAAPSRLHLELTHLPSEVSVAGEVPLGRYSREEMKKKKEELRIRLWLALDLAVARKLRLPGQ